MQLVNMDKSKNTVPLGKEAEEDDCVDDGAVEVEDCQLPVAYMQKRHLEKIEGTQTVTQTWRMKERVWSALKSHMGLMTSLPYCLHYKYQTRICYRPFSLQ